MRRFSQENQDKCSDTQVLTAPQQMTASSEDYSHIEQKTLISL